MKHASRILAKGDACCRGASPFYLVYEKEYLQIILHGILLAPTCSMLVGTHTYKYVCQWTLVGPVQEALCGAQAV
jgi:hypothetical protein